MADGTVDGPGEAPALATTMTDATAEPDARHAPRAIGSGSAEPSSPPVASSDHPAPPPRAEVPRWPRLVANGVFGVCVTLAFAALAYFAIRFLIAPHPPRLTRVFRGAAHPTEFASASVFDGPMLASVRDLVVGVVFLATTVWLSPRGRDPLSRFFGAAGALAGVYSISVTVLTSTETLVAVRAIAAVEYCAMPAILFVTLAIYPSGRPVPRWSAYVIPVALVPFVLQAIVMVRTRGYSASLAGAGLVAGFVFLGFQVHRYRRHASPRERHQIKWLSYAGGVFVTLQAIAISMLPALADTTRPAFPVLRVLYELLLLASYLLALATMLFSAARYRLWEIDRVLNRTLVYALVTALLVGAAAVTYFVIDGLLRDRFAASAPLAMGVGLALVIAAFAPVRRRVARWIDRRFFGIGVDYEGVAAKAVYAAALALPDLDASLAGYGELVLLGRGGMGAVYRAQHPDFAVPIALKVMSPSLAARPAARARFRREADVLARLRHPSVVPFLAAGHERGLEFLAMQYIEGDDLATIALGKGRLHLADLVALVEGVASALDLAHRRGVVHRDVKPANILVERSSHRAVLVDFGVAWLPGDEARGVARDAIIGSLPFMAPEQIQTPNHVDGRADVYALGATAYTLVTGRPPFDERTPLGLVMAHLHQSPPEPCALAPGLPLAAGAAIVRALAKDPAERFATAGELARALRSAVDGSGAPHPPRAPMRG